MCAAGPTKQASKVRPTRSGEFGMTSLIRHKRGFTRIELMVLIALLEVLVSVALPMYQGSPIKGRDTILRQNLFSLRTAIDEYTYDNQKAPQSLEDLVQASYLRKVPIDPITTSDRSWKLVMEDASTAVNQS